jgi:inorganic pyrophosphatase
MSDDFWTYLDRLVAESQIVIDRPKGSHHPRFPEIVYPLDYGYLDGTTAGDGGGIDVWRGSRKAGTLSAVIMTVDLHKRDTEIKILLGCTETEIQTILDFHNDHDMRAALVRRPRKE